MCKMLIKFVSCANILQISSKFLSEGYACEKTSLKCFPCLVEKRKTPLENAADISLEQQKEQRAMKVEKTEVEEVLESIFPTVRT